MAMKLFDSLSREARELRPAQPDGIFRFYNCGPTVYASAHIGNFRTFVINDVLRRLLELEFPGKVKHVRNLTDVDDRTIGQARQESRPLAEITRKWTDLFHADCVALNYLQPHVEPAATGHIREQVDMIDVLLRKGNAYRTPNGSVYFKIGSFPAYGALSRIKERELKVTNSVFDADHKDDVGDFALWKAYKPEEDGDVKWPGPSGAAEGRPGWHIECSAMTKKHLGDTIDLHTGAVDLLFPHHENEIAQSQCCNGAVFVRHWYHSEHLLVDGTTMSKSKGQLLHARRPRGERVLADGRPVRPPWRPSPQAAQLHARFAAFLRERAGRVEAVFAGPETGRGRQSPYRPVGDLRYRLYRAPRRPQPARGSRSALHRNQRLGRRGRHAGRSSGVRARPVRPGLRDTLLGHRGHARALPP